jgi:two-component system response regulator YesN
MQQIRLLIAEDEENTRNSLERYIRSKVPCISEIHTASDGQEAFDLIIRYRYHIMLIDIQMPLKTGFEVIEQTFAAGICPFTIILSGHDDFAFAQKAIRYGVVDYLLKPCRSTEIKERIEDIISKNFSNTYELISSQKSHSANRNVDDAINYLHDNYPGDLTLTNVAEQVGVSPNYLSTLFSRNMGCSFVDYLNKLRIERACEYFYDSKIKGYEIAFKVGFKDEKYFFNVFKRVKGVNPSEYRNSMR